LESNVGEKLKCNNIVEEYEDQKVAEVETFYTPLDSLS